MNRLGEIEVRMKEIGVEVDTATGDELRALDDELNALTEERQGIKDEIEKRQKMKEAVLAGAGTVVQMPAPTPRVEQRTYTAADEEYRDAWAKTLMGQPLAEVEMRALVDVNRGNPKVSSLEMELRQQQAVTTTSEVYVAPGGNTVGINNGGLFIPKYVSDLLLENLYLGSPILEDIRKMSVPGMISYPYKKYADPAQWVEEGVCNDYESIEWDSYSAVWNELSKTIQTTRRLEALTPEGFVRYLIDELRLEMQEERVRGVVYGAGGKEPSGIKENSYAGTYTVDGLFDTIVEISQKIKPKFIPGAKLYVARDLANKIALAKNPDGSYILPPINSNRITGITQFPVEIDPYLNEGDAILANLQRGVILNTAEAVSITRQENSVCKTIDYTAWELISLFVLPGYTIFLQEDSTPTP